MTTVTHKDFESLDIDRVMSAIEEDDMIGFCLNCGAERYNCEPDARHYPCEICGARMVFGAEECLLYMA